MIQYQLTVIGAFAQAIVASEMKNNQFSIKTTAPNVKVSWQVTGIHQDAYANAHCIPVEEDKPELERGHYLHPDAFGQPGREERRIRASSGTHAPDNGNAKAVDGEAAATMMRVVRRVWARRWEPMAALTLSVALVARGGATLRRLLS